MSIFQITKSLQQESFTNLRVTVVIITNKKFDHRWYFYRNHNVSLLVLGVLIQFKKAKPLERVFLIDHH